MDLLNGYRARVVQPSEHGLSCDVCRKQREVMVPAAMILVNVHAVPKAHVLCAEHVVELATGWGCMDLDEAGAPIELPEGES